MAKRLTKAARKEIAPALLSREHLVALGNLAAYWGWLEIAIEAAIWALLRVSNEKGAGVTTHLGTVTKLDILRTLARNRWQDEKEAAPAALMRIAAEVEQLRIKRNGFTHYWWEYAPRKSRPEGVKRAAKGHFKITREKVHASDIQITTYLIWMATTDLLDWITAVYPKREFPWPDS
jgi:hypothetical protein